MNPWLLLSLVASGAALGGVLRHLLTEWIGRPGGWPLGTLLVNVSGSATIGALAGALQIVGSGPLWPVFAAALLGSYTTVSAFSLDTLNLVREGRAVIALGNIAASLLLCLGAAAAGFALTGAPGI